MFKSYQLVLSMALLFGCLNLETRSFARNFHTNLRRSNSTHVKPATNYQPWVGPGFNSTRPRFNETRVVQPLHSSPQYGAPYQGTAQQPNIGFHDNFVGSGQFQPSGTYGFGPFSNGTTHGNFTYAKGGLSNGTYPYGKLFKLW
ncbi:uncharacterized protein LOC115760245 [Drosophila novamexicana]|uniref:uncharacterized protein LOC115760245 n=1 Tax=Drosophila novamexicana TaxID=47314 RepID=UPI0011E5F9F7|nr:uncharacterized protein LOC115760245 [Drosophila novamexicana]